MRLRIGTRGSQLALWQANHIRDRLLAECDDVEEVEFEIIKTRGDTILDRTLSKVGGKGLFITEIEDALLDGRVDIAVHSMKDMPAVLPDGLTIAAVPERANPRDAFVTPLSSDVSHWRELPNGAVVGTSSLRRTSQLLAVRPDLEVKPLRGNVDTRLRKLDEGHEGMSSIILASAGLERLGWRHRITSEFEDAVMTPAVGQGALAIEARTSDEKVQRILSVLEHTPTREATMAERTFLRLVEGSCQVPVGGFAKVEDHVLSMTAFVGSPDGSTLVRAAVNGASSTYEALGARLADEVLESGGRATLSDLLD